MEDNALLGKPCHAVSRGQNNSLALYKASIIFFFEVRRCQYVVKFFSQALREMTSLLHDDPCPRPDHQDLPGEEGCFAYLYSVE